LSTPELSVVIVSYRCAGHLSACLRSLDHQSGDVDLEVIVVDNASGDDTVAAARAHRVHQIIERPANDGFAVAANAGMDRARGAAVLALNPDTVVPTGALRACLDHLWANDDIGVLTPRIVDEAGHLDGRCHRSFPTAWSAFCFVTGLDRLLPGRASGSYLMRHLPDDQAANVDAVSGAFMLMRRDALHEVGGFDQQFFMYAEDIDLCMRFAHAGWRVVYWPFADVIHVGAGSAAGGRRAPKANAAAFRTMSPLVRKHRSGLRGVGLALAARCCGEALLALSSLANWITLQKGRQRREL
jgi:N-acetylglucosaminyl-diphospho-decaprenol L-rhamnosyltransferase